MFLNLLTPPYIVLYLDVHGQGVVAAQLPVAHGGPRQAPQHHDPQGPRVHNFRQMFEKHSKLIVIVSYWVLEFALE